ncbi:MAG: wax ester/triacylglycerol synthase domain-containing protein, partial [Mycobacterium sp.]
MTAQRMAAVDAQFYWMSAKIPNDEFLLYAFDGEPADYAHAIEQLRRRANADPALTTRVRDGIPLTYPQWVAAAVTPERVIRHDLDDPSWAGSLAAVVALADDQLDVRRMPWRLHVFTPVLGVPGVAGPGSVAVMQVAHALADGARASAMAAWLFGRADPVPEVQRLPAGFLPWRAAEAARTHRQLLRDTRAGRLAPGAGLRPLLPTNARPDGARAVRTLVRHRSQF